MLFFDSFKDGWQESDKPEKVRELWALVQRHLPKAQERRMTRPAIQQEALREKWQPHLCALEAGGPVQLRDLYQELVERQKVDPPPPCLEEIPTLAAIEMSLRSTKPGNRWIDVRLDSLWCYTPAPRLFDLVLKMMVSADKPIQWKGGSLHMLPKGPAPTSAAQYRGIMLLGVLARRVHALFRGQVTQHAAQNRPPGQLGGFPHEECSFGNLYVNAFMRRAYHIGLPSAVIFVDLQAAFHSVIRQLVLGQGARPW